MKNKTIIVVILMTIFLGASIYTTYNKNEVKGNNYVVTIFEKNKSNVDDGASMLIQDEKYNKLSEDDKIKDMEKLLKLYSKKGDIKKLYYDSKNKTFTFEYKDGVLGGMKMTKFDSKTN